MIETMISYLSCQKVHHQMHTPVWGTDNHHSVWIRISALCLDDYTSSVYTSATFSVMLIIIILRITFLQTIVPALKDRGLVT